MRIVKRMLFLFFIYTATLSFCFASVSFNLYDSGALMNNNVLDNNQKELFGVAPGGGNKTFSSYKYYNSINQMSPDVIRLEAITSDHRKIYDPDKKVWNFSILDQEIDKMNEGKKTIIANVFYTPKFLSTCPDSKFYAFCIPNDMNAWSFYVSSIAQHVYQKYGIKYWEIGNEPSGKFFFTSSMNEFYNYYILTAKAIKKVNGNILVGGFADNAYYLKLYSDFFSKIRGSKAPLLDFVTFHWYGDWGKDNTSKYNPKYVFTISNNLKLAMNKNGFTDIPIFLTEWNLVGNRPAPGGKDQVNSYFIASLYWLKKSQVDKSLFFRVEPYNNTNASLLDYNGNKNTVGDFFSILNNSSFSNISMKNNVYLFSSDSRQEIILSNYDLDDVEPKNITIHFGNKMLNSCNKTNYTLVTYSNGKIIKNARNITCTSNDSYINLTAKNFSVIHIKY